jgi:hypothetical protein
MAIDTRSAHVAWRMVNRNSIASRLTWGNWSQADHNDKRRAIPPVHDLSRLCSVQSLSCPQSRSALGITKRLISQIYSTVSTSVNPGRSEIKTVCRPDLQSTNSLLHPHGIRDLETSRATLQNVVWAGMPYFAILACHELRYNVPVVKPVQAGNVRTCMESCTKNMEAEHRVQIRPSAFYRS